MVKENKDKLKNLKGGEALEIVGKTTHLRLIQASDIEQLRQWRNHNRHFFFHSSIITEGQQKKWFKNYEGKAYDLVFLIQTQGNRPIGTVSLYDIDPDNKTAEYGRMLIGSKNDRQKGYAQDATNSLLNFGFSQMGLQRIILGLLKDNQPAIKLYKKIGFKEVNNPKGAPNSIAMVLHSKEFLSL